MKKHTSQYMSLFSPPEIKTIEAKKVVGISCTMSFSRFTVSDLWVKFIPKVQNIPHRISSDLLSIAIYQPEHFIQFDPSREFEKWAATEVDSFDITPDGLDQLLIPAGQYAVFHYKGLPSDNRIFQWIYSQWLPHSDYQLDQRPHFEVLGERYKNGDPDSEEDIYIPIKEKM